MLSSKEKNEMQKFIQYVTDEDTFYFGKVKGFVNSVEKEFVFIAIGTDENEKCVYVTYDEFNRIVKDMVIFQKEIS